MQTFQEQARIELQNDNEEVDKSVLAQGQDNTERNEDSDSDSMNGGTISERESAHRTREPELVSAQRPDQGNDLSASAHRPGPERQGSQGRNIADTRAQGQTDPLLSEMNGSAHRPPEMVSTKVTARRPEENQAQLVPDGIETEGSAQRPPNIDGKTVCRGIN